MNVSHEILSVWGRTRDASQEHPRPSSVVVGGRGALIHGLTGALAQGPALGRGLLTAQRKKVHIKKIYFKVS